MGSLARASDWSVVDLSRRRLQLAESPLYGKSNARDIDLSFITSTPRNLAMARAFLFGFPLFSAGGADLKSLEVLIEALTTQTPELQTGSADMMQALNGERHDYRLARRAERR
jgi:hypothetical protein